MIFVLEKVGWLDGPAGPSGVGTLMLTTPQPSLVETLGDWVGLVSQAVTIMAVFVGGVWAYFKFIRGRTLKPRLIVKVEARWDDLHGAPVLYVRTHLTNIGATKFALKRDFSALRVSFPSRTVAHQEVVWDAVPLLR